ncbi:MAG: hypothetical protein AAFR28_11375 [Pseudomonadota bacterium]
MQGFLKAASRVAVLAVALLPGAVASADSEQTKALLERRAELERELAAIEAELAKHGVPVTSSAAPDDGGAQIETGSVRKVDAGLVYAGLVEIGAALTFGRCDDCFDEVDDESYPEVAGAGRVSLPLGESIAMQLDVTGWNTFTDRGENGEDNLQTAFSTAAHLAWRDPTIGAAGVFAQVGSANGGEATNATFLAGGAQAQYYLEDVTLYGQLGYFVADDGDEYDVMTDAVFGRGVVRWFPQDRTRLQAQAALFSGEEDDNFNDAEFDGWSAGLRADHAFSETPFTLFAAYDRLSIEADRRFVPAEYEENRFMIGAAFHFGVASPKAQDRQGATFESPDIGRWIAPTLEIVDD